MKPGDRVVLVNALESDEASGLENGMAGVVIEEGTAPFPEIILVKFDELPNRPRWMAEQQLAGSQTYTAADVGRLVAAARQAVTAMAGADAVAGEVELNSAQWAVEDALRPWNSTGDKT